MSKSLVNREAKDAVEKIMEDEGIDFFYFERRANNHSSVVYTLPSGRSRFYIFASTPSDRRAILNLKSGLRRTIQKEKSDDHNIGMDLMRIA